MYSCRVKGNKAANLALPAILQLPSVGLIIAVLLLDGPAVFVIAGAALLSVLAFYLALKSQLTEFVYEISDDEVPGQYDLIITSVCGKRIKTECRISISGSICLLKDAKPGSAAKIRLCPWVAERPAYIFDPSEFGDEWRIVFCPDDEMLRIMQALGTEVKNA